MIPAVLAGLAAGAAANAWSDAETKHSDKKQKQSIDEILSQYQNLSLPEIEQLNPELYQSVGDLNLQGVQLGKGLDYSAVKSAFDGLSTDPKLREEQMATIGALDELAQGGGFNAADKANLNRVQNDVAQADRGRRDAILQNMGARGMGGSGMELLAQLQSSQAATDRANQSGLDIAGMAQQRALDAMIQKGNMAGNIRGQDFGEKSTVAAAKDAITKFNATNTLDTNKFNIGRGDQAAYYNSGVANDAAKASWANNQDIRNKNTGLTNDTEKFNKVSIPQQNFENNLAKTAGIAKGLGAQADYYGGQSAKKSAQIGNIVNGGLTMGAASIQPKKKPVAEDEEGWF